VRAGTVLSNTTSTINYTRDAAGNLTSDGLRVFEYDAQNRHSKTVVNDPDEGSKITYLHNALGQRVFKSEPQVDHLAPNATVLGNPFITWLQSNFGWMFAQAQLDATLGQAYVYDDGQLGSTPTLLAEYGNGGSNATGRIEYLWLPTQSGQPIPIGQHRGTIISATHSDHLGTPRKITGTDNNTAWQLPYSAFGENSPTGILTVTSNAELALTNDAATATRLTTSNPLLVYNLRFPGQYFDDESKLNYNYFRSYDPRIQGGYTQPDPIGLAGGLNRFSYVGGNPLSWSDPEGLQAEHTNNARPSTVQKHQEAEARRARDAGGEKGDQRRRPPSTKPPGHKGPWPIIPRVPGVIPLICPLCEVLAPQPIPGPEPC
jgi:RHS repeat-associated protein